MTEKLSALAAQDVLVYTFSNATAEFANVVIVAIVDFGDAFAWVVLLANAKPYFFGVVKGLLKLKFKGCVLADRKYLICFHCRPPHQ